MPGFYPEYLDTTYFSSIMHATRRCILGSKRHYQRYKVHVDGKVKHGGITTDFERRKEEHKQNYPDSIIRKVGGKATEKTAREWEKDEGFI